MGCSDVHILLLLPRQLCVFLNTTYLFCCVGMFCYTTQMMRGAWPISYSQLPNRETRDIPLYRLHTLESSSSRLATKGHAAKSGNHSFGFRISGRFFLLFSKRYTSASRDATRSQNVYGNVQRSIKKPCRIQFRNAILYSERSGSSHVQAHPTLGGGDIRKTRGL